MRRYEDDRKLGIMTLEPAEEIEPRKTGEYDITEDKIRMRTNEDGLRFGHVPRGRNITPPVGQSLRENFAQRWLIIDNENFQIGGGHT
jgi:hypothetical protein